MFVLGLILVLIALVVILFVALATSGLPSMEIDWTIFTAQLSPLQLYFLGAATVLVLAIGMAMLVAGMRKQSTKRAEVRRLRQEVKASGGPADSASARPADSARPGDREPAQAPDREVRPEPARDRDTTRAPGQSPETQRPASTDSPSRRRGTASLDVPGRTAPGTTPPTDPERR